MIGKEQVGEVIDLAFALKKVRIRGKKNVPSSVYHFNRVMLTDNLRRYCRFGPGGPVIAKWLYSKKCRRLPRGFIDQVDWDANEES